MKRFITIISIVLLLISFVGCDKNANIQTNVNDNTDNYDDINNNDEASNDDSNSLIPLQNATKEQLSLINVNKNINGNNIHINLAESEIIDNIVYFSDYNNRVRKSSKLLLCKGIDDLYDTDIFEYSMKNTDYISSGSFDSPYNIVYNQPYAKFNGYSDDPSDIMLENFDFSYTITDVNINAFIKKNDDNKTFNCIIDPAYMYNIPLYHNTEDMCVFNVNGTNIKADTLSFDAVVEEGNDKIKFDSIGNDYVYSQINVKNLEVHYQIDNNDKCTYKNIATLSNYTPITENTNQVLNETIDLTFSSGEKDPNMQKVYDCLVKYIPDILNQKVVGIVLLDLDFDTFPELLVSTKNTYTDQNGETKDCADVAIYKIEESGFKYIDTIYNYDTTIDGSSNILAVKTLDNGSKAWFNMSYKNRLTGAIEDVDYLFTLSDDKLNFTEIFRTEVIKDNNASDDSNKNSITNYYFLGKLMEFGIKKEYSDYFGGVSDIYTWNDYSSIYGKWALIANVKQDYCKEMRDNVFDLYSDWLKNVDYHDGHIVLTDRMLRHELAYLVDSYYLGNYSPEKSSFYFEFIGGFAKPVIYLYPEKETAINVTIDLDGALTCTYPRYKNGWNVTAKPDGTLINKDDAREYSYLYWEGIGETKWDMSKGFVVKGSETIEFLQEKLEYLGLTAKELNEFIVYWLPQMQNNKYNLITFQTDVYEQSAKLNISPKPDSMLRIFMVFKGLDEFVNIEEQELPSFERNGFTVIEWGGIEIK